MWLIEQQSWPIIFIDHLIVGNVVGSFESVWSKAGGTHGLLKPYSPCSVILFWYEFTFKCKAWEENQLDTILFMLDLAMCTFKKDNVLNIWFYLPKYLNVLLMASCINGCIIQFTLPRVLLIFPYYFHLFVILHEQLYNGGKWKKKQVHPTTNSNCFSNSLSK